MGTTLTSLMEKLQSESEHEEEMSFEQKISQHFSTDEHLHYQRQAFGQGLFTKGGGSAFPPHRRVILSLGLLNAVLLIVAVVIGIYCAKAKDLQIPHAAASPFIIELNFLRNNSEVIRASMEAQAALKRERSSHQKMKLQVRQRKNISDELQRKMEVLQTERTNLKTNKTSLEESCGRCQPGWILLKSTCYYLSHRVYNSKRNWPDSREHCISQGGDLVVIDNLEEQQILIDNFPKVRSSSSSGSSLWWQKGFWIGLTDAATRGTWVWVNNVTEAETMYWRTGQPTNDEAQSKNCVAFHLYLDNRRTWYNLNCKDQELNWICEMAPN